MTFGAIAAFRLVSAVPGRLVDFYTALGFGADGERAIPAAEMTAIGLGGTGLRRRLTLGPCVVELDTFSRGGRPYPADTDAADLVFQHLALVTDDAATAWSRAIAAGARPISRGGPVNLPASSGGVTAVKFRDPEGHPLELLQFPPDADPKWTGHGLLGIDHSAVSVSDLTASRTFYERCGLVSERGSFNHGPTQCALDGLDGVEVDVAPLAASLGPSHVELLAYRTPRGRPNPPMAANDVAATRIVWRSADRRLLVDPDGHLHQLDPV